MRPFSALFAAVLAIPLLLVPASAQAAIPPQEPGVTLRVFDVQRDRRPFTSTPRSRMTAAVPLPCPPVVIEVSP